MRALRRSPDRRHRRGGVPPLRCSLHIYWVCAIWAWVCAIYNKEEVMTTNVAMLKHRVKALEQRIDQLELAMTRNALATAMACDKVGIDADALESMRTKLDG